MENVFITVNHLFGKVIGVKSFVRVHLIFLAIFSVPAFCANSTDDVINGKKLFLEHCHSCHATSSHQVPSKAMLRTMSRQAITLSMQSGLMKLQAQKLSVLEMDAIARYLSGELVSQSNLDVSCEGEQEFSAEPTWLGWGNSLRNDRYQKIDNDDQAIQVWNDDLVPAQQRTVISSVVGGVSLLTGAIVWVKSPSPTGASVQLGLGYQQLELRGRW